MPTSPAITAEQMRLVLDVSRMLSVTSDLDRLLHHITESVAALLRCERASIFLHDADTNELWTKVALGLNGTQIRIPATVGIVGAAFGAMKLIHVSRPYEDPRFNPANDKRTGFVTRNILSVPMFNLELQPIGVVQAINKRGEGSEADADFNTNDLAMVQLLADQAGVAIQRFNLQQAAVASAALRKELDIAKKVQEAMIPRTKPDVPGLDAAGWTKAASVNGGDCFDLWKLSDGRLGILVADASGHGIGPALIVMQARTLIRTLSESEQDPLKLLVRVNKRLSEDMVAGRFVTVFLGFLSPGGKLEWASGAHAPILFRPRPGAPFQALEPGLPPIGILSELIEEESPSVHLEPGGSLIITSDGISEAFSPDEELYGEERLIEMLDTCDDCEQSGDVILNIHRAMIAWQSNDEPKDDQTVVVIRRLDNSN